MDKATEAVVRAMLGLGREKDLPARIVNAYRAARANLAAVGGGVFTVRDLAILVALAEAKGK